MEVPDGRYSIVYSSGDYRTLRFKTVQNGGLAGKRIVSLKNGVDGFEGFGFLTPDNRVVFWKRFREVNSVERLARIQKAVMVIIHDPVQHGVLYAMKEKCCSRCGRTLTTPASLFHGLGPECAKVGHWRKGDHQEAFEWTKRIVSSGEPRNAVLSEGG